MKDLFMHTIADGDCMYKFVGESEDGRKRQTLCLCVCECVIKTSDFFF